MRWMWSFSYPILLNDSMITNWLYCNYQKQAFIWYNFPLGGKNKFFNNSSLCICLMSINLGAIIFYDCILILHHSICNSRTPNEHACQWCKSCFYSNIYSCILLSILKHQRLIPPTFFTSQHLDCRNRKLSLYVENLWNARIQQTGNQILVWRIF